MITTSVEANCILLHFESLVKTGKINGFSVSIQQIGLLIRSEDGVEEQAVILDNETFTSVETYFDEIGAIPYGSLDYTSLKSLINAKAIIDRMLHNKDISE